MESAAQTEACLKKHKKVPLRWRTLLLPQPAITLAPMTPTRRDTLRHIGTGLATGIAAATGYAAEEPSERSSGPEICCFTKMFQELSYQELAELIAEIGFDGIEGTIRPGGHIEPGAVPDELPKMVEALRSCDRDLTIMASGINEVSNAQSTETVLRTAAELGVKRYRMAYYRYDLKKPLQPQLDDCRAKLKDLAALNRELGIQGLYQNHAGSNYVGAAIWDICELIEDLPREAIASAFDIRHATAEATSSWQINAARAMPLAASVYVKDFQLAEPKLANVPLGEGRVDPKFFKTHRISELAGPVSLHVEYLSRKEPDIVKKGKAAYRRDLSILRKYLGR